MKTYVTYSLVFALLVSAVGCGKAVDNSSPQNVAESFSTAVAKDDWSSAFKCMTKESQDLMLFPIVFALFTVESSKKQGKADPKMDSLNAILKKHGVSADDKDSLKKVKDKGALFGDFMKWSKENSTSEEQGSLCQIQKS